MVPAPSEQHGDVRRLVLDAALGIIESDGAESLSMREVARRAGVSHQAPYHYFGDRSGILAAISEEGFTGLA
ncbi:MAG: TetR family transcriptional regulator, partial [Actinobacteria bacterium]|nr:TetR family transcriptional regulator [Actinomycetota bacterium]